MSNRIDPFLSQENHNHLLNEYSKNIFPLSNEESVNEASIILQNLMVDVARTHNHRVVHMPALQRLKRLNEYILSRLIHKHKSHKTMMTSAFTKTRVGYEDIGSATGNQPGANTQDGTPDQSNPNRSYRYDEKIIIINSSDRDWADSEENAYEFSLKFNPSETYKGLSIDDNSIINCTAIEPVALFIPQEPSNNLIDNAPYLVLDSDAESNNVITSTQRRLNGENVALTITDSDSKTHYKYINIGKTLLKPTSAIQSLSSLELKLKLPNGTELVDNNNLIYKNTGYTSTEFQAGAQILLKYIGSLDWHIYMTELPPLKNNTTYDFDFQINGANIFGGFSNFKISGNLSDVSTSATNGGYGGNLFTYLTQIKNTNPNLPVSKFTSNEYKQLTFATPVTTVAGKLVTQGPATSVTGTGNTTGGQITATGYVVSDLTAGNDIIISVTSGTFNTTDPVNIVDSTNNGQTPNSIVDPYAANTFTINWISLRDTNATDPHLILKTYSEVLIS